MLVKNIYLFLKSLNHFFSYAVAPISVGQVDQDTRETGKMEHVQAMEISTLRLARVRNSPCSERVCSGAHAHITPTLTGSHVAGTWMQVVERHQHHSHNR